MSETIYTPKTLAERWQCDEKLIYRMIADGRLKGFKLARKLLRITAEAVAEYEAGECQTIGSDGSRESSSLSLRKAENAAAIASARANQRKLAQRSKNSFDNGIADLLDGKTRSL